MRTIDKYILLEILKSSVAVSAVLYLIFFSSAMASILRDISQNELPKEALLPFVSMWSLNFMMFLIPISLFFGAVLAMGRLYQDSEMVALRACGYSYLDSYRSLSYIVPFAVTLVAFFTLYVNPYAVASMDHIKHVAGDRSQLSGIKPGSFNISDDGKLVLFSEKMTADRTEMFNIFLQDKTVVDGQERFSIERAKSAKQTIDEETGDRFMVFQEGIRYESQPTDALMRQIEFEQHGILIKPKQGEAAKIRVQQLPTAEIWGSEDPLYRSELHWRLALPVATIVLLFIAIPAAVTQPRKDRFGAILLAILLYIAYTNLLGMVKALADKNDTDALSFYWVHAGFFFFGAFLLARQTLFLRRVLFHRAERT
ncbi:MAG: LPS export ABC transporter permease LptF [Gammaproteobacteria bacterium]|nr:LPS export ABC transporter permease LptF [Gammaproteobacteria bacterium]